MQRQRIEGDPLPKFLADPRASALDAETVAQIDAQIQEALDHAVERALAADDPTPDKLYTDVYINYEGELRR
jgi:TPP-dependent pyruvate/acetoin dehydrogenase alpha subunit